MTTTQDLTLREAQLKEAARELLQLSKTLHQDQTDGRFGSLPGRHYLYAASALQVLVTGDIKEAPFTDYSNLIHEVAAEERNALGNGDPAVYFNSPDALIEAINEERAELERMETHPAPMFRFTPESAQVDPAYVARIANACEAFGVEF